MGTPTGIRAETHEGIEVHMHAEGVHHHAGHGQCARRGWFSGLNPEVLRFPFVISGQPFFGVTAETDRIHVAKAGFVVRMNGKFEVFR